MAAAMSEESDPRVTRVYRQLGDEEPPAGVDAAIRAAARREADAHPAPLVAPTGRRKWYFPVAAAAVIVLAVAVSWQVERERPATIADGLPVREEPQLQAGRQDALQAKPQKEDQARREAASPAKKPPAPQKPSAPQRETRMKEAVPAAPPPAEPQALAKTQSNVADAARPAAEAAARDRAADRARAVRAARTAPIDPKPLASLGLDEAPAPWLERIARLRKEGRHEEADKALAEFRQKDPDYKIAPETLERVERR